MCTLPAINAVSVVHDRRSGSKLWSRLESNLRVNFLYLFSFLPLFLRHSFPRLSPRHLISRGKKKASSVRAKRKQHRLGLSGSW